VALIPKRATLSYFFMLTALVVALRLPSLNRLLDTDSSVNAFFARQMLHGEILYDKFHPAHHLPGIYYTFVLAFKLFGDTPVAPKLLLIVFMLASTWLIFLMGRTFFNDFAGILGALFYILTTSQIYLAGMTAEMEHFANLPLIATMFLCLVLLRKNSPPIQFIWVGILAAICILYKVIFVGSLAAAGISMLIGVWLERNQIDSGRKLFSRLASMAIGLMLPLILVAGFFASMGLWQRLLLVFKLGFNYVNDTSLIVVFPKPFGFPLFMIAMNNMALLVFGLIGTYRLVRRALPLRTPENLTNITLALWLIFSLALTGFRGGGFPHYPLIAIPPLALITGIEISLSYHNWQITSSKKRAMLGAGIMSALIVINFFWRNYDLYRQFIPKRPGQATIYQLSIGQQEELFDYVASHTTPGDFIYVWSINLQLYYYADRLPPIDIVWPSYISATGPPERIFNPRTKYIVVDNAKIFSRPQWLLDGLEKDYRLETVINGMEIYRRT
jgi:4-amino-4-deoxy-L-arabinose transferase-like glycosyltransferase